MENIINKGSSLKGIFGDSSEFRHIDVLVLNSIMRSNISSARTVDVRELSFKTLASYWQVNYDNADENLKINEFSLICSKMISSYGLTVNSSETDVFRMLNYAQDRHLEIELYGIVKPSLKLLSQIGNTTEDNQAQSQLGVFGKPFFKQKGNKLIEIDASWHRLLVDYSTEVVKEGSNLQKRLLQPTDCLNDIGEDIDYESLVSVKQNSKALYEELFDIEKRITLQMNLNKKQYSCLEEALFWLNMDSELFNNTHDAYCKLIRYKSFRYVTEQLPLVTAAMLIYSAVYLYNDDESGGYWNGFFGSGTRYNYQRDVELAMQCLGDMVGKYKIDTRERHYLEKRNLSEIFSHIYLPEISLKKMFTALYLYYFKNRNHHLFNKIEFLEVNEHRLDKPGLFFLEKDNLLEEVFDTIIEFVEDGVKGRPIQREDCIPNRFYEAFDYWIQNEKASMDYAREKYYISTPSILLDNLNDGVYIYLPKQKSRLFSDEECGWEISIDNEKFFKEGRIIRQQSGNYLVLDEQILIYNFQVIKIAYIFNGKKQEEWVFENSNDYLVFDKGYCLQKKSVVKRGECHLVAPKEIDVNRECIVNRYEITGWKDYLVYSFDLTEYQGKTFQVNQMLCLSIEDEPAIKRDDYKLLFENWNTPSVFEDVSVYEYLGKVILTSPHIEFKDIQIYYYKLSSGVDMSDYVSVEKPSTNNLVIVFNEHINTGAYKLTIKYKNKTCFREVFIIDHESGVENGKFDSYEKLMLDKRQIKVKTGDKIEIISDDLDTRVEQREGVYFIDVANSSIASFIYRFNNDKVNIKKIIKPYRIEVVGLDELIEVQENDKIKEITKEAFANQSLGLYVKNLDTKYDYLSYELVLQDEQSDEAIVDNKKIKLGDEFSWDFNGLSDRISDFKNIKVILNIRNAEQQVLYTTEIMHVIEHIRILNFNKEVLDNNIKLTWDEGHENKQRNVRLYNITTPSERVREYEIDDGVRELVINLASLSFGVYRVVVGFRKKASLFDAVGLKIDFTKRIDVKNCFVNSSGDRKSKEFQILTKCTWDIFNEKPDAICKCINALNIEEVDPFEVMVGLIQMKYLAPQRDKGLKMLQKVTYKLLSDLVDNRGISALISLLLSREDELEKSDLSYVMACLLALGKTNQLTEEHINLLSEYDFVEALCASDIKSGTLGTAMINLCQAYFDSEVWSPDVIHNHSNIYKLLREEAGVIKGFWDWLIEPKNSYLFKYNYSKARLFRMYEIEKEISTNRIAGLTIDDMVDNLGSSENCAQAKIPSKWHNSMGIEEVIYNEFIKLVNDASMDPYKDILTAAFISIVKIPGITEEESFEISLRCRLSSKSDMYNRYRAYLKLIFL